MSDENKTIANMTTARIAEELGSQLTYTGRRLLAELVRRANREPIQKEYERNKARETTP
jgi:hypothetical protein